MTKPVYSMITTDLDGESKGEVVLGEAGSCSTTSTNCDKPQDATTSSVKEDVVLYGTLKKR